MCLWTRRSSCAGSRRSPARRRRRPTAVDAWTWVFLVAALNEEITIADSVERLLALDLADRQVIVIDDGSDDRTPEILAAFSHPTCTCCAATCRTRARARPRR